MIDLPELFYNEKPALAPQVDDLKRLYGLIRGLGSGRILEFGCGYSTFVIAEAIKRNKEKFDKTNPRNYVVDTNEDWINHVSEKLKECGLAENTIFIKSKCNAGLFESQLCNYYDNLPNIVPDFIYLDGPDPFQIEGSMCGLGFQSLLSFRREPMNADILLIEPFFFPNTFILIDGRFLNARFLKTNLKRNWNYNENRAEQYTIMELIESG